MQHLGPVLAFGAACSSIDLDISVVGVGLAGEQRGDLVAVGALGELGEAADRIVDQGVVAFRLGKLHQLGSVGELALERPRRADRLFEPAPLAHHVLRRLGIVPQRRVFDLCVQLLQPLLRAVPVEEPAQQRGRGVDLVDMGLRFGAHRSLSSLRETIPLASLLEAALIVRAAFWVGKPAARGTAGGPAAGGGVAAGAAAPDSSGAVAAAAAAAAVAAAARLISACCCVASL